jgi:hypothetical protein
VGSDQHCYVWPRVSVCVRVDAEWPEALLLHKSTCLDTAGTLDHKRRQRQERWQRHMQRELNSTRAGTGNPSTAGGPAGNCC